MMVKAAQPGEGGGERPSPLTLSTITSKVVVYAPTEKADPKIHSPYFYSIPICTLWLIHSRYSWYCQLVHFRKKSHWKSIYTFEETAKKLAKKMFDKVENVADNYFLEI